ncbi:MAG: chemotaxis protein CheW [Alphaproteobacteria bacterium]|jgi:purine-binding chemotaxis protein CheW|nr:chemotaxis protein CheW [Alphaproteobacteria bacterium]MBU1552199.1 chemotaxis protein CheW [Alphaproteobacteria bacterium]MBU2336891.1 chemotaxis protein CheW [Alphaproteobacteria bacterium]MBU2389648.1 chemotaxis protein CheW [Alphaproteobacteria bacterium]
MAGSKETQFVTFSLGEEIFALPVEVVREILDHEDVFKVPHGPNFLLGLRDVRGQGVPIIDLRLKLGMERSTRTEHTRILVLDVPMDDRVLSLGLVADKVFEVTPLRSDEFDKAPDIGMRWDSDYIAGVARRDDGFVVILDLARMFCDRDALASSVAGGLRQVA